jgi:formylglycine-generating enzyme
MNLSPFPTPWGIVMLRSACRAAPAVCLLLGIPSAVWADVFAMPAGQTSLLFSPIGDSGNAPDTRYGGSYGAVPYSYRIGTYEVTAAQYCQFLNAVAKDDTYGLYNPAMAGPISFFAAPCGISRIGSPGDYTYTVITGSGSPSGLDHSNYPVNYLSWGDAVRFINWLHNGQPIGAEGPGTTEDGAYTLTGATTVFDFATVTRSAGARYWLPTEDEWYKAAYYKGGGTAAGYWDFATKADVYPGNSFSPTSTNNANYLAPGAFDYPSPIDYLTNVGAFGNSPGPYSTYDMSGNVAEMLETHDLPLTRILRGSDWGSAPGDMAAYTRLSLDTVTEWYPFGFRVATSAEAVPEPSTLGLLAATWVLACCRRRRGLAPRRRSATMPAPHP